MRQFFSSPKLNEVVKSIATTIEISRDKVSGFTNEAKRQLIQLEKKLEELKADMNKNIKAQDAASASFLKHRKELVNETNLLKASNSIDNNIRQKNYEKIYTKAEDARNVLKSFEEEYSKLFRRINELELEYKGLQKFLEEAEFLERNIENTLNQVISGFSQASKKIDDKNEFVFNMVKVQEEERKRIAREIHDGPAQTLATLIMSATCLKTYVKADKEKATSEADKINASIKDSIYELRQIIYDLRPHTLDDLGLFPAIRGYIENVSKKHPVKISLKIDDKITSTTPLNASVELIVYRITQEIINNVVKHSNATKATLVFRITSEKLLIDASDNGDGFNVKEVIDRAKKEEHYGLIGIKERVDLLQGKVDITSKGHEGTKIKISIPLKEKTKE